MIQRISFNCSFKQLWLCHLVVVKVFCLKLQFEYGLGGTFFSSLSIMLFEAPVTVSFQQYNQQTL